MPLERTIVWCRLRIHSLAKDLGFLREPYVIMRNSRMVTHRALNPHNLLLVSRRVQDLHLRVILLVNYFPLGLPLSQHITGRLRFQEVTLDHLI